MSQNINNFIDTPNKDVILSLEFDGNYSSNKRSYVLPTSPVKWDEDVGNKLFNYLLSVINEKKLRYLEPPFEGDLKYEIIKFFTAVDAYEEAYMSEKYLNRFDLFKGVSEGPSFTKSLKALRNEVIVSQLKGKWFSKHVNTKLFDKRKNIFDIGQIFNYQYLILWEEKDDEDYKFGFLPVNQKEETLELFRKEIRSLISGKTFRKIDRREILMNISSSSCLDPKTLKSKKNWSLKGKNPKFSKNIGTCKRIVIPVAPGAFRDSVLVKPASLNTIQFIDRQVFELLQTLDNHIMLRDEEEIKRRFKKFYKLSFESKGKNLYYTFMHRDIKKEGITKPRNLLKIMLEELNKEYPDVEAFRYSDFYDDFSLLIDKEEFHPCRGHGLGMANSLTTLMQLGIMNIISKHYNEFDDHLDYEIDFLCLNDDLTVRVCEKDTDSYWYIDEQVLKDLGIVRAVDKNFQCRDGFVLAEKYFGKPKLNDKKSYHIKEILNCLNAVNITHAKSIFSSIVHSADVELLRRYSKEIISYWGYEFFIDEYKYPAITGGWIDRRLAHVDLSLLDLQEQEYNRNVIQAFYASKINRINIPQKGKKRYLLFYDVFPNLHVDDDYRKFYNIGTEGDIKTWFLRTSENPKLFKKAWDLLYKKRRSVFKQKTELTFNDFCVEIIKSYQSRDFYPLDFMIEKEIEWKYKTIHFRDLYVSESPLLSALKYWNQHFITDEIGDIFSIKFINTTDITKVTASSIRKKLKEFIGEKIVPFTGELATVYIYSDDFEEQQSLQRSYLNPQGVGIVNTLLNPTNRIPVLKEKYRNPLIRDKENIYGRFLTPKEEIVLQVVKERSLIKKFVDMINKDEISIEDLEETLNEVNQEKTKESDNKSSLYSIDRSENPPIYLSNFQMKLFSGIEFSKKVSIADYKSEIEAHLEKEEELEEDPPDSNSYHVSSEDEDAVYNEDRIYLDAPDMVDFDPDDLEFDEADD